MRKVLTVLFSASVALGQTGSVIISNSTTPDPTQLDARLRPGSVRNFTVNAVYSLQGGAGRLRITLLGPAGTGLTNQSGRPQDVASRVITATQGQNVAVREQFNNVVVPNAGPVTLLVELLRASEPPVVISSQSRVYVVMGTSNTHSIQLLEVAPAEGTAMAAGQRLSFRATVLVEHPLLELANQVFGRLIGQVVPVVSAGKQFSTRVGLNQFTFDFSGNVPDTGTLEFRIHVEDLEGVTLASLPVIRYNTIPPAVSTVSLLNIDPSSAVAGGPAFQLSLSGQGFSSSSRVEWDTTQLQTTFVNAGSLRAQVPASLLQVPVAQLPKTVNVRVRNATGTTAAVVSNAIRFDILPLNISAISPDSAEAGGPALQLNVTGLGFVSSSRVEWDNTQLQTTFVTSGSLRAQVPASLLQVPTAQLPKAINIRVRNPPTASNPAGSFSNGVRFEVQSFSRPDQPITPSQSPHRPPTRPFNDTLFTVDNSPDLDTPCTYRTRGSLRTTIPITRFVGETDADGRLVDHGKLIARGVAGKDAVLRLSAFDVDSAAAPVPGVAPEKHEVFVNGRKVGELKGTNNSWAVNEFLVPVEILYFPSRQYTPGEVGSPPVSSRGNIIEIRLDTANIRDAWCTAVDWVSLHLTAHPPLVLIHGTNADSKTWGKQPLFPEENVVINHLRELRVPFEHRIDLELNGSAEANAAKLSAALRSVTRSFGVKNVHLITHSKGATDSRAYLAGPYATSDKKDFRVLSLFALGTPSKGTVLSDYAVLQRERNSRAAAEAGLDPFVVQALADAEIANVSAMIAGAAPVDPALSLQTTWGMEAFNKKYRSKAPGVCYISVAADADIDSNGVIDDEEFVVFLDPDFGKLPIIAEAAATRIYATLGRTRKVNVTERNTIFRRYRWLESVVLLPTPERNDLTATVDSVHCTECGFIPLRTAAGSLFFPANHSTIKSAAVIDSILEFLKRSPCNPR